MSHSSTGHEVLAVVFQVRQLSTKKPQLSVLLWERAMDPQRGAWSLPGGRLRHDEDMTSSVRRQLAEKVDLRELTHLEQLAVFSDPQRCPGGTHHRVDLPGPGALPRHPGATARYPLAPGLRPAADGLRPRPMVTNAHARLNAKLSYTNIGFALAPKEFALSTLRDIYSAALGHPVDATNLQRVLERRNVITRTGTTARSGRSGGRPAALYRFTEAGTGSPTNSRHCGHQGESDWLLRRFLSKNARMDFGSSAAVSDADWIGAAPARGAGPLRPSAVTQRRPLLRRPPPASNTPPPQAPCCAAARSSWPSWD